MAQNNDKFYDDLIAELLAVNMALHRTLDYLANESGNRRGFLTKQLELGLEGISKTKLSSVPQERHESVYENARSRYQNIIGSVKP